jgi:hypothetical protein
MPRRRPRLRRGASDQATGKARQMLVQPSRRYIYVACACLNGTSILSWCMSDFSNNGRCSAGFHGPVRFALNTRKSMTRNRLPRVIAHVADAYVRVLAHVVEAVPAVAPAARRQAKQLAAHHSPFAEDRIPRKPAWPGLRAVAVAALQAVLPLEPRITFRPARACAHSPCQSVSIHGACLERC